MSATTKGWRRLTDRPAIPNQQTETDLWVAWKNRRIGGNSAATICGVNKYQTLDQLYDKIVHGIIDPKTAEEDAFLSWRLSMEPLIADRYSREQDRTVRRRPSQYDDDDAMLVCNPDYEIVKIPEKGVGILELKSRDPMVWNPIKLKGAPGGDWVQTQFYLMVSRLRWGSICEANVSTGKQLVVDVEADFEFQKVLRQRIGEFLDACERGERPAPVVPVERIPEVGGELVTSTMMPDPELARFHQLATANLTARAIFKQAEEFKDATDEDMKRWLLRNGYDVAEGFGGRFYYKEQAGRASLDKAALKRAHPEVDLGAFEKKGAPFRTFRVYARPESLSADDERRALNAAAMLLPETE